MFIYDSSGGDINTLQKMQAKGRMSSGRGSAEQAEEKHEGFRAFATV